MQEDNLFNTDVEEYEKWFQTNDKLLDSEVEAIKHLIPISGKGIEIGVGTGIFASRLGIRDGVEPSDKMAAKAAKKGVNVIHGKAEKIHVDDGSYQFVLMVTVDCFLEDVLQAFSEVHRILVKGGVFIIAFLDKATPLGQLYENNKHLHKSYKNANFHSSEEMTELLNNAGFEILERKQTIYTLENKYQESKAGFGEGIFAVIKAMRS
ncbi:class I SAM-dependent methyltransferase [Dehalobacterium formicoaceticum]|uniref:Class I SAM-dependent methyltransferase n=1 Tax=Dehalobacterium formicoaceticum TaxID=51515 RepID=A0ABT1Y535_9FIRM|nr:class I SAM-dependent methyltransferase [Dehalobacterium formicoaceticum]MCR6545988.1 class I SAM-dependent methyltransferase [Dehalobacterium formicoaceticum]